jgi:IS4 transposase
MFSISRFHALMNQLPREAFSRAVAEHEADKHCKGFTRWQQLQVMIYAQLSGASSLRTLAAGFNAHASHHYHLGATSVKRSTLADANRQASPEVFAETVRLLMQGVQRTVRRELKPLLHLLDSTSITLKGRGFDEWTFDTRSQRTQGMKLHVMYANEQQAPCWSAFSDANVNDIDMARTLPLQAGRRYVFDKGYCNYSWWHAIHQADAIFVTRFKRNAALRVDEMRLIPEVDRGAILADEIVRFTYRHNRAGHTNPYQAPLRRITVDRPEHETPLVIATNDLDTPAAAIAEQYKARWGIELFFKWIKQHLRLTRFFGRTQNAVKIQILTALIAYLLVVLYRHVHTPSLTLWACLAELRLSLFQRPHIEAHHRSVYQRRRQQAELLKRQAVLFG